MKTNKPEVVCHAVKAVGAPVTLKFIVREDIADEYMNTLSERHPVVSSSPLIHLSAYEALQAECEKMRMDAERYRFIRDAEELPMNLMRLEMIGDVMDSAIDAAMQEEDK